MRLVHGPAPGASAVSRGAGPSRRRRRRARGSRRRRRLRSTPRAPRSSRRPRRRRRQRLRRRKRSRTPRAATAAACAAWRRALRPARPSWRGGAGRAWRPRRRAPASPVLRRCPWAERRQPQLGGCPMARPRPDRSAPDPRRGTPSTVCGAARRWRSGPPVRVCLPERLQTTGVRSRAAAHRRRARAQEAVAGLLADEAQKRERRQLDKFVKLNVQQISGTQQQARRPPRRPARRPRLRSGPECGRRAHRQQALSRHPPGIPPSPARARGRAGGCQVRGAGAVPGRAGGRAARVRLPAAGGNAGQPGRGAGAARPHAGRRCGRR